MLLKQKTNQDTSYQPMQETALGLFFSSNDPQKPQSRLNLQFSSSLREDSLFIKQLDNAPQIKDDLTSANIFFPEGESSQQDTVSWPVDLAHSESFEHFCKGQQNKRDPELQQAILLKLCHMLHLIHYHELVNYPITGEMIRISDQGEPMMMLLPVTNLDGMSTGAKEILFNPQYSAPETMESLSMNPGTFSYNLGMLAALMSSFMMDTGNQEAQDQPREAVYQQLLFWLQKPEDQKEIRQIKDLIMQSLQQDPSARPFCPMQIYKALGGTACVDCRELGS
jgi:hypothetical protein